MRLDRDRFKAALVAIIEEIIPNRKFFAPVEYIVSKAEGGTFSADPANDAGGYPPIADAPVRGLASANASKLAAGSSILVGWIEADRARPYLVDVLEEADELAVAATSSIALDAATVTVDGTSVTITGVASVTVQAPNIALAEGAQPVARVGDLVMGIFPITSGNPKVRA